MRRAKLAALAAAMLIGAGTLGPVQAGPRGDHEVRGVEADDMLKMRVGPGIGYNVLVGLPNGTVVRVHNCEPSGGTSWCKVSLKQAPGLRGYVSAAYLVKR